MFQVNDIVRMVVKMKEGVRVETARVAWVDPRSKDHKGRTGVYFGFTPCARPDSVRCGFGAMWFLETSAEYGLQSCEVVGTECPMDLPALPNLKGNPGYDLMM